MADIAAAAEITRGTLYRHFPARESLIKALEASANEEAGPTSRGREPGPAPDRGGTGPSTRALVGRIEDFIKVMR